MDMNLELTVTIGFSVVGGKSNNIGMMSKSALPLPLSETRIKRCLYECKEALERVATVMRIHVPNLNLNLEIIITIGWSVVGGKSNIGVMNKLTLPLSLSESRIKQCLDECKEALETFMTIQPYHVLQSPQGASASASAEEKKRKHKHATAIMREIARDVADQRGIPSIFCTLRSFKLSSENRKFCVDALEKRSLFGRGGYAMYVRDSYEDEYRNRMRKFINKFCLRQNLEVPGKAMDEIVYPPNSAARQNSG
jgi:hypothetical protein